MLASFVVHGVDSHPAGGVNVLMRPVVNEDATNREWSPGAVPEGEIRLRVTSKVAEETFVPGARVELRIDPPAKVKPAAKGKKE